MIGPAALTVLVGLDSARAESILCRAIDSLLPNVEHIELGALERKVLEEARAVADSSDDSGAAEVLNEALASYLLPAEEEAATKNRLGADGDLPLSMYEVVFSWPAEGHVDVSQDEARVCIENASLVDHLKGLAYPPVEREASAAEVDPALAARGVELGLKAMWPEDAQTHGATLVAARVKGHPRGSHWLLVIMRRETTILTVESAWRVFDDVLPPGRVTGTRWLFQALLGEVGMPLALPGNRKRLLYWNEEILLDDINQLGFEPPHHRRQMTKMYAMIKDRMWHVLLFFSIDYERYTKYVNKHAVRPS
jgi:hypothetical protein